jgi:hypothetical protein
LEYLRIVLRSYQRVLIVTDALDEASESTGRAFVKSTRSVASSVRLLVTSRPLPSIEKLFVTDSKIKITATNDDIEAYVHHVLNDDDQLGDIVKSDSFLASKIVKSITEKAQNMFVCSPLKSQLTDTTGFYLPVSTWRFSRISSVRTIFWRSWTHYHQH